MSTNQTSVLRGTVIVGSLTVLSRVLGFIRDLISALIFGASPVADCFFVAFRIPNLLRSFVAEGALTSAFVPVFSSELNKGKDSARGALREITGFLIVVNTSLAVLGIIFAPEIVQLFAPGFGKGTEQSELCILLTRIMMPFIISISIVAMLNGALNAVQIFGAAAFSQVVLNLALIVGGLLALIGPQDSAVFFLAWSVIVGGVLQIIVQLPSLRRAGFSIMPKFKLITPAIKEIVFLMLPALLGATVYQISIFVQTMLASLLKSGSVSWLFYADRVVQLPIGIYSIALASVLLPTLSNARARADEDSFSQNLVNSLRFTSFITLPISVILVLFAEPIVSILFERGAFTSDARVMTAHAIQGLAIGVWAMSAYSMLVRAFIAKKDTTTPTIIGALTLLFTITLSIILMGPPERGVSGFAIDILVKIQNSIGTVLPLADLGHVGLAVSSSAGAFFSFGALLICHRRRAAMNWNPVVSATWKSLLASIFMGLSAWGTLQLVDTGVGVFNLVIGLFVSVLSYLIFSQFLRSAEFLDTSKAIKSKLHKKLST